MKEVFFWLSSSAFCRSASRHPVIVHLLRHGKAQEEHQADDDAARVVVQARAHHEDDLHDAAEHEAEQARGREAVGPDISAPDLLHHDPRDDEDQRRQDAVHEHQPVIELEDPREVQRQEGDKAHLDKDLQPGIQLFVPALLQRRQVEDVRAGHQHAQDVGHQPVGVVVPEHEGIEIGVHHDPPRRDQDRHAQRRDGRRLLPPPLHQQAEHQHHEGDDHQHQAHDEGRAVLPEDHPVDLRSRAEHHRRRPAAVPPAVIGEADRHFLPGAGGVQLHEVVDMLHRPAEDLRLVHVVAEYLPVPDQHLRVVEGQESKAVVPDHVRQRALHFKCAVFVKGVAVLRLHLKGLPVLIHGRERKHHRVVVDLRDRFLCQLIPEEIHRRDHQRQINAQLKIPHPRPVSRLKNLLQLLLHSSIQLYILFCKYPDMLDKSVTSYYSVRTEKSSSSRDSSVRHEQRNA